MSRRWKIFLIVGVVSLVADQVTKLWARHSLPTVPGPGGRTYGMPVEVIPNFWDWRLSHNPGSAFGLFSSTDGARIFLSVIGILAVFAIFWMVKKAREDQTRLSVALGLVVGGAVGNLVDRVGFGVVTDFVVWKYGSTEWPTFNVADVTLVVGVALLFIDMSAEARREAQQDKAAKDAGESGKGQKKSQQKKR
jgi:signal peptidase II